MRAVYIRVLELTGRFCVIPFAFALYHAIFFALDSIAAIFFSLLFITIFCAIVGVRELQSTRITFKIAITEVEEKLETLKNLSSFELLFLNLYRYHIVSCSSRTYVAKQEEKIQKSKQKLKEKVEYFPNFDRSNSVFSLSNESMS